MTENTMTRMVQEVEALIEQQTRRQEGLRQAFATQQQRQTPEPRHYRPQYIYTPAPQQPAREIPAEREYTYAFAGTLVGSKKTEQKQVQDTSGGRLFCS